MYRRDYSRPLMFKCIIVVGWGSENFSCFLQAQQLKMHYTRHHLSAWVFFLHTANANIVFVWNRLIQLESFLTTSYVFVSSPL